MLSIIVPIHNGAQYLRKCISSILSSSYQDFEIILVENASTDNSLDLCRQLGRKNSCIKIISTEVGGVSHARNLGLDAADGEYITFVDCDDYISPYMYETLMRGIVDTGADIIFCDIKMGNDTGFDFHQPNYSVKSMSKDSFFYNTYMKSQYKYSVVWNKLYRKENVANIRFDETLKFIEDRNFVIRCVAEANSIAYIDCPLYYYYRGNETSISASSSQKERMDQIHSGMKNIKFFKEEHSETKAWREYASAHILQNADFRLRKAREAGMTDEQQELKSIIKSLLPVLWQSNNINMKEKARFLLEHYFPNAFQALYKLKELKHG